MNVTNPVLISKHVINSINALPEEDRGAIAIALVEEMVLGNNPDDKLSPFQAMLYSMIRFYVKKDSHKIAASDQQSGVAI
ncbi:MAG: hypothetical protein NC111_02320 [Bacteroides sp.]|nr:hypothetical protein [Bacteroides sp.]MCM1413436.1 hypothetical protein [Bacteroides sp.]MCM1471353.1 hypothetical protein [Bacteroides sp.]